MSDGIVYDEFWTEQDQRETERYCDWLDETQDFVAKAQTTDELRQAIGRLELEVRRRTFEPDGYLYVLRAGSYYKIGRSKTPDERIRQLRIQLPWPVEVAYLFPCEDAVAAEAWFHWLFAEYRVNGEWFVLHDELLSSFNIHEGRGGILLRKGEDCPVPVVTGKIVATP